MRSGLYLIALTGLVALSLGPGPDAVAGPSRTHTGPAPAAVIPGAGHAGPSVKTSMSDARQPMTLPAPDHLASTDDPTVCTAHGGLAAGLACKALLPQGRLALVWDYPAGSNVAGFHIFRVDGGQRTLIYDQPNGAAAKAYVVDSPPQGGYASACYAVTAYNVTDESASSTPFCGGQARTVQTLTLAPQYWRVATGHHFKDTHLGNSENSGRDGQAAQTGQPTVGYSYATHKTVYGDKSLNLVDRLGLKFDVAALVGANKRIVSARLQMTVDSAWTGSDSVFDTSYNPHPPSEHRTSCAAKIGDGISYWENYADWIESTVEASPGVVNGPSLSLDVTRFVNAWVNQAHPNYGLVLQGEEENLDAFTEQSCWTTYVPGSIRLQIQYD